MTTLLTVPIKEINDLVGEAIENASKNGANSVSMPDEYVAVAHFVCYPEEYGYALPANAGDSISTEELCKLLPDNYYMDLPDGGDTPVLVQLQRMSKDAHLCRYWRGDPHGANELLDFIYAMGKFHTGKIRADCNLLLRKHGRPTVPMC